MLSNEAALDPVVQLAVNRTRRVISVYGKVAVPIFGIIHNPTECA